MIELIVVRLTQGDDLKQQITHLVKKHGIHAGSIASCVGCLSHLNLRLADSISLMQVSAPFEILSLSGTLTDDHCHIHITVADAQGRAWGGHLLDGNIINTTAELMIHHYPQQRFSRQFDPSTGYSELVIE
ncbi:PPC domain-containing DNA-binding protein [Vibrio metoecus]|uniref:PPC domain-containing DNA-binding protein n=1 Tax=Vibrio metoecus TaxID=1481663 RepID=UPI0006D7E122|nr:PPC domain-containing DNA-binding protein [Vibrio metoecus]KQA21892.1 DNA-binding protein [Vibrio metoecus]